MQMLSERRPRAILQHQPSSLNTKTCEGAADDLLRNNNSDKHVGGRKDGRAEELLSLVFPVCVCSPGIYYRLPERRDLQPRTPAAI